MTRSKGSPPVHKPAFDEESVLSFAAAGEAGPAAGEAAGTKDSGAERILLTLRLKPEVVARLREEAARKEKRVEQVVEKLVNKHLGKH